MPDREVSVPPRCSHCGEVIGVYEPLVVLVQGQARETSRLLEPLVGSHADVQYHRACFDRLDGDVEAGADACA